MHIVSNLWRDENGFVMTSEAVIIAAVLLALLVGWSAVRVAIVTELVDTANKISGSNTYSVTFPNATPEGR